MKTTKAAFKRFAEKGLQYHGSTGEPLESIIKLCQESQPDDERDLVRDPVTVRSNSIVRHKGNGSDSYLELDKIEVYQVNGYWLIHSKWESAMSGESRQNTVIYS